MTHVFALLAAAAALIWITLIVPIVARLFGMPLPLGLLRRRDVLKAMRLHRRLLVDGILSWGGAIFIYFSLNEYLSWKYLGKSLFRPSLASTALHLLLSVATGMLVTWLSWGSKPAPQTL